MPRGHTSVILDPRALLFCACLRATSSKNEGHGVENARVSIAFRKTQYKAVSITYACVSRDDYFETDIGPSLQFAVRMRRGSGQIWEVCFVAGSICTGCIRKFV